MNGLKPYLALLLRTRWPMMLAVALTMAGVVMFTATSMADRYTTRESLDDYAAGYGATTGMGALLGRGQDIATLGGATANEVAIIALILFPALGVIVGVRLTRSAEYEGLLDILSAGKLSPRATIVAAVLAACAAMAMFCAMTAGGLIGLGYPAGESVAYVLALALLTLSMTALGIVVAQVTTAPSEAYGVSVALVMALYLARAFADSGDGPPMVWNPQAWLAEATPWADRPTLWPYAAWVVLVIGLTSGALLLRSYRDLGAGVIQPRPGPASAASWIRSSLALQVKMASASSLAWGVGAVIFAFAMASIADDLTTVNRAIGVGGETDRAQLDRLVVLFTRLDALLAMGFGLQRVSALRDEETSGRAEWMLSTSLNRGGWWLSSVVAAMGGSLMVLLAAGLATATGLSLASSADGLFADALLATVAYAPAVLLTLAVASFLCAVRPRLTPLAWMIPGWTLYVILVSESADIPASLRRLSPLEWIRNQPVEPWSVTGPAVLLASSLLLAFVSLQIFRRRDLNPR